MSTGRPTKYSKEMLEKTRDYLNRYEAFGDAVPSAAGLAVVLGVARSTLYTWASDPDKSEFSDMLDAINAVQERVALSKGLNNEFNATIVKLLLAKHGYHDKQSLEHSGPEGGEIKAGITVRFVKADG